MPKTKVDYSKKTSRVMDEYRGVPIGRWIELPEPFGHTRFVKFRLYHTGRYYALQIFNGYGEVGDLFDDEHRRPSSWSRSSPEYRKDKYAMLSILARRCRERKIELKPRSHATEN